MVFLVDAGMLQDWLTDKRGDSFRVEDTRAFNLRNPGKSRHTSLDLRIEVLDHRVDTDGRAAVARALVHGHPTLSSTTPVAVRLAAPLRDDFRNFELCQQNLRLAALSREEATHYPALLRVHESFELRLPTTRLAGVTAGRGEYVPVWGEIMEWGTPLQQVLRDGCLSEQEAVALLLPVLRTVGRLAEKQHIVHRDIDEGNVFLVDGQPKLGDFGAATTLAEDASYTKTRLLGKTGQCPPEYLYSPDDQEGPEGITSQMTDAWLLGRLLLRMTTGAGNPYHPDTPLGEKYHPSLERLSSPLQDVVRGLCAPQWDERLDCAAAAQMLTAQLPALATGVPSPAPLESGSAQTPAVASRPLTAHEFFRHWMFDGQGSPQSVHRCLYSRSPIIVGHPINFVLTAAGHLYTWGFYFLEQRRQGAEGYRSNPTRGPLDNVTAITTGWAHSMALTRDGHLYTWGRNPDGQLGDGTTKFRPTPTRVPLDNVTTIAAGWRHSMALTRDGHLYTWGHNGFGQLGDGTKEDRPTPTRVPLDNITAIATCTEHSMALTSDGYLYTWGDNFSGQLGDGTKEDRPTPTRVPLNNVTTIAAGSSHSMAITSDGHLYTWGRNRYGLLRDRTKEDRPTPTRVPLDNVTTIIAGWEHSMAITSDGHLYTWGHNPDGQLGDGTTEYRPTPTRVPLDNVTAIAAGDSHSMALTSDGHLYAWGKVGDLLHAYEYIFGIEIEPQTSEFPIRLS